MDNTHPGAGRSLKNLGFQASNRSLESNCQVLSGRLMASLPSHLTQMHVSAFILCLLHSPDATAVQCQGMSVYDCTCELTWHSLNCVSKRQNEHGCCCSASQVGECSLKTSKHLKGMLLIHAYRLLIHACLLQATGAAPPAIHTTLPGGTSAFPAASPGEPCPHLEVQVHLCLALHTLTNLQVL